MVRVARLELAASCSQSRRATSCATPGNYFVSCALQIKQARVLLRCPKFLLAVCSRNFDRCHSLGALFPPPAVVASLPNCATPGYGWYYTRKYCKKQSKFARFSPGCVKNCPGVRFYSSFRTRGNTTAVSKPAVTRDRLAVAPARSLSWEARVVPMT